ncbi:MAG: hypothetical protein U1F98_08175 [Verrucomicrobiota bacterium]
MQISRRTLLVIISAATLLPLACPAEDNEAQSKARQALEQATNPGAATNAAIKPKAAAPVVIQKPAPQAAAAAQKTTSLQDALNQKMQELDKAPAAAAVAPVAAPAPAAPAPPPAPAAPAAPSTKPQAAVPAAAAATVIVAQAAPPPAPAPVPAPAAAPAAKAATAATATAAVATADASADSSGSGHFFDLSALPQSDPQAEAKAQQALGQKMVQLDAIKAPVSTGLPEAGPALTPAPKAKNALPALSGPPPALPADKEARLQALLQQYKADQISPEEYHAQRAKILAE